MKRSQRAISIDQVREILESEKELNELQRRVLDYTREFSKNIPEKSEELINELIEKFRLTKEEAVQIVNCMPETTEELEAFIATSKRRALLFLELKEILKVIDQYRSQ